MEPKLRYLHSHSTISTISFAWNRTRGCACRKHVKVEPDLWYYYADQLGILVWQGRKMYQNYTTNFSSAVDPDLHGSGNFPWIRIRI